MTVACALPRFRQRALIDGGWTYEGGASITTYFMGACLYDFPNEFRRYRVGEERYRRALQRQQDFYEVPVGHLSVSDEVIGNLEVLRYLYEISDPRLQKAVALTIDGCSQEAIRQILDEKSVRAIEALLYRWRTKKKRDGGEGDQHDQSPGR